MATGHEGAVAAAVEALRKASMAADPAALDKLIMPEISYGHATGRLETKAQYIESLTSGKAGYSSVDLSKQTITVSDKTAVVRHRFVGQPRKGGDAMTLDILQIWVQQPDQQWKLLSRQAVKPS
jgi:hypothetical protein